MSYFNKIVIVIMLFIIQPAVTLATDWRIYGVSKDGNTYGYFDKDSIQRKSSKVIVWTKYYLSDEQRKQVEQTGFKECDHLKELTEFNCKLGKRRSLSSLFYNKRGELIDSSNDVKWSDIVPDSMECRLKDVLCGTSPKLNYIIYLGDETKKIVPECDRILEQDGMIGLVQYSQEKYKELKKRLNIKNMERCVAIDLYCYMMDSSFAKAMGRPTNSVTVEYFSIENFQKRIIPYLYNSGFTLDEANQFIYFCEVAINNEINKTWEKQIYE